MICDLAKQHGCSGSNAKNECTTFSPEGVSQCNRRGICSFQNIRKESVPLEKRIKISRKAQQKEAKKEARIAREKALLSRW